jgi:hypothetical protein
MLKDKIIKKNNHTKGSEIMRVKKKRRQTKIFNCSVKMNWKIALTKIKNKLK